MSTSTLPPRWQYRGGRRRREAWQVAHYLITEGTPALVVEALRLMLPCQQCGAPALHACVRGLGEVEATHLSRGA